MAKKILIIAPEVYPKVKVGGLGKVIAGLSDGLSKNGIDIKIISPEKNIYFPINSEKSKRANKYLAKKAISFCRQNKWSPDFVWTHDWSGVEVMENLPKTAKTKFVWTIHSPVSLGGQYSYNYGSYIGEMDDKPIDWGDSFFDFKKTIKRGCYLADNVTTVSRSYARYLNGLEIFKDTHITGIDNGIDKNMYGSEVTSNLWTYKFEKKSQLQKTFGLAQVDVPVFAFVSRLVSQKGLDHLLKILPKFLANHDVNFIFLGDGDDKYKKIINFLKVKFPQKIGTKLVADFDTPKLIYFGSDFLVLPSLCEPYGLVVSEAKMYGTIPIVHLVDGLCDQVNNDKNGFGYYHQSKLSQILNKAVASYHSQWYFNTQKNLKNEPLSWQKVSQDWISYLYG